MDVDLSVGESARKEIREKAGLEAQIEKVIAVQDREKHNLPVYAWKVCKIFLLCRELGGSFRENPETVESRWFSLEELPNLAEEKNTRAQIEMCFAANHDPNWRTIIE